MKDFILRHAAIFWLIGFGYAIVYQSPVLMDFFLPLVENHIMEPHAMDQSVGVTKIILGALWVAPLVMYSKSGRR